LTRAQGLNRESAYSSFNMLEVVLNKIIQWKSHKTIQYWWIWYSAKK